MNGHTITIELDLIQTTAVALVVLFIGYLLNRWCSFLRNYNIPEPVVGGIVYAILASLAYTQLGVTVAFDMTLKTPLMLIFFTTIGLGANIKLLIKGGPKVMLFLGIAVCLLIIQNTAGISLAKIFDIHPLQGLISGSITLSGGHGTGATYADIFRGTNNLQGAMEVAMASATFGLVFGGLIGGPVTKRLIDRYNLTPNHAQDDPSHGVAYGLEDKEQVTPRRMLETLLCISLCMAIGGLLYAYFQKIGVAIPAFVCTLLLGVIVTNVFEFTGIYKINQETVDLWGTIGLSIFLAKALMSLQLWELLSLALSMFGILFFQTLVMALFAYFITFRLMGKNYDAAVIAGGHCGFGMGATPTAVANMEAIVSRYGPSPQAFLIVPMVGAFFIDLVNAMILQGFISMPFV